MPELTDEAVSKAASMLERHREQLFSKRSLSVAELERDLRSVWSTGYQELKRLMIGLAEHGRYQEVAAYYMEHANASGVVTEFQAPLAKLYGVKTYHYSPELELMRDQFWARAFAGT
jgi:hypothetical protein